MSHSFSGLKLLQESGEKRLFVQLRLIPPEKRLFLVSVKASVDGVRSVVVVMISRVEQ